MAFDASAIKPAWHQLRNDGDVSFIVFKHSGTSLEESAKGSGGLSEFKNNLDPSQVLFGGIRVLAVDGESKRSKFIFVTWVGPEVTPLKRARATTETPVVREQCPGFHVSLEAREQDDITEEIVIKRLKEVGGSHAPDSFEF